MKTIACFAVLLASLSTHATVDQSMINLYQEAANRGGEAVEKSYETFKTARESDPADAVALFYLGASETLMARDSWLPWKKLSLAENGIARMDKALTLLTQGDTTGEQTQTTQRGLPQDIVLKGIAAATFTQMPEFFNTFERGYSLYHSLMNDSRLARVPAQHLSWIYCGALDAAVNNADLTQANTWYQTVNELGISSKCSVTRAQLQ